MKMTHYIKLINKTFYFRKRYPKNVVEIIGMAQLKRSLGTDSYKEACKNAPPIMQEYLNNVTAAERELETQQLLEPRDLTDAEIMGLAASWVKANQTFQPVLTFKQTNSEDIGKRKEAIANYEERIRPQRQEQLSINEFGSVVPQVRRQLKNAGIELDLDNLSHLGLCQTMLRAVICLEEKAHNERKGLFNTSLQDNILQLLEQHEGVLVGQTVLNANETSKTLSELIEAYTADRISHWKKTTVSGNKTAFDFLIEALGGNTTIDLINRDEARKVLRLLEELPKKRTRLRGLRHLSLDKQVKTAMELELELISVETINSAYLSKIKPLFGWAEDEQLIDKNPFIKLRSNKTEEPREKPTSIPVSSLQELFNHSPWSPREENHESMPSLFWGPLIALHHGCRVGEVASLFVSDIIEESGVPAIGFCEDVDEFGNVRDFKTGNGVRVVPIHPQLLKIGFMRFVAEQKRAGYKQLFPEHKISANNQWGRKLTKWFNPTIREITKEPLKHRFHSFRHNFQDALRDAGLHGTAEGQALSGRTATFSDTNKNADTVADGYGTRFKVSKLAPLIAKVQHEGIDLSHLYIDED